MPGLLFACVLGLLLTGTALLWTRWPAIGHPVSIRDAHKPSADYYLAYDGGAFYVGARMWARNARDIQAPLGRRDVSDQAEYILIALDTFLDRRTAFVLGVTASGVRLDRYHGTDAEDTFDSGYFNGWDLTSAAHPQTILAYARNDQPLPHTRGAPLRLYSPVKLGYKLTKYLSGMSLTAERPGGYWEDQGYPWLAGV